MLPPSFFTRSAIAFTAALPSSDNVVLPTSKYTFAGSAVGTDACVTLTGAGEGDIAASGGAGAAAGAAGSPGPMQRASRNSRMTRATIHGHQRPIHEPAVAPAAASAAPAIAAPARRAAAPVTPPALSVMLDNISAGLAKPRAPVSRLSSAPCRNGACAASMVARLDPPPPVDATTRLITASTIGATSAIRLPADCGLRMPDIDASAPESAAALSPNSDDTTRAPLVMTEDACAPPPLNSPPRFDSIDVSIAGLSSVAVTACAPAGVAPFWATPAISAGTTAPIALAAVAPDSPMRLPAMSA